MLRRIRSFLIVLPLVGLLALALVPGVAFADDGMDVGAFSVFNSVEVGPNETVYGDAGSIFSSVNVMGHVTGDVFSIFSSVNISGQAEVDGDVFSVFSSVNVGGNAVVHGNVTSAMSTVNKSATARIEGEQITGLESGAPNIGPVVIRPWDGGMGTRSWGAGLVGNILGGIFSALLLAAIGVVIVVLMPKRIEVIKQTVAYSPWASLGVGFLGLILSVPLALVLLLTCVGFFIVAIGTFLLTLVGLVAIGLYVGQRVMEGANGRSSSPVMDVMVGTLIMALILGGAQHHTLHQLLCRAHLVCPVQSWLRRRTAQPLRQGTARDAGASRCRRHSTSCPGARSISSARAGIGSRGSSTARGARARVHSCGGSCSRACTASGD